MRSILTFIKKRWYLFVALAVVIVVVFVATSKKPVQPAPNIGQYKSVKPGITTSADLKSQLGQPINITQQGDLLIYKYPSQYNDYPSDIFLSNDKVVYVREPVRFEEKRSINDYLNDFGQPDIKMYSPNLGPAIPGFIYASRGLAVFAHSQDGSIVEVWYFVPTTIEGFKSTWGKDLTETFNNKPE